MDVEVVTVEFLTPARVTVLTDGVETSHNVAVDLANQRVYREDGQPSPLTPHIFRYLNEVNTLPEDFFAPPDQILPEDYLGEGPPKGFDE